MNVDFEGQIEKLNQAIRDSKECNRLRDEAVDNFYSNVLEFFSFWAQIAMNARESYDINYKNLILENIAQSLYGSAQDLKKNLNNENKSNSIVEDAIRPSNKVLYHSSL